LVRPILFFKVYYSSANPLVVRVITDETEEEEEEEKPLFSLSFSLSQFSKEYPM